MPSVALKPMVMGAVRATTSLLTISVLFLGGLRCRASAFEYVSVLITLPCAIIRT